MAKTNQQVIRVAIIGAESTGKTTLARSLALRFHTEWVPEYAREYMAQHQGEYTSEDVVKMMRIQLEREKEILRKANKIIFTDTEIIIAKVWCEDVFGVSPEWFDEHFNEYRYDLYLLTANDLPWVPDPVRVNPQRRGYFFDWYKRELDQRQLPYEIISGRHEARLLNAVKALEKHFGNL